MMAEVNRGYGTNYPTGSIFCFVATSLIYELQNASKSIDYFFYTFPGYVQGKVSRFNFPRTQAWVTMAVVLVRHDKGIQRDKKNSQRYKKRGIIRFFAFL